MRVGYWILGIFILASDQLSKFYTHKALPLMNYYANYPYGGIGVFKDMLGIEFSITHLTNKGAAWGSLAEYQLPLLFFRMALIGLLIFYLKSTPTFKSHPYALLLIIFGAIGNVIDYFLYGHVIDMFHFVLWGFDFPVFNVADAAVTMGISWLMLFTLCQKRSHKLLTE